MKKVMTLLVVIVIAVAAWLLFAKVNTHARKKPVTVAATSILKRDLTALLSQQKTQTKLTRSRHFGIQTITVAPISGDFADYCHVMLNNPNDDINITAASRFPDIPYIESANCIANITLRYFTKAPYWRVTEFSTGISEKSIAYPAAHKQLVGEFSVLFHGLHDAEVQIQHENKTQATWRVTSNERTQ